MAGVFFRWLLALALLTTCAGEVQAADPEACRVLRARRDALATRAMEEELALVRTFRNRICPRLARQAERANARDQRYEPLDYASWNQCRLEAERQLERSRPVLHRNRQAFTFYSKVGAELAEQADRISAAMKAQGCP